MGWTEEQKERVRARNERVKQYKIDECAEAIQNILTHATCRLDRRTIANRVPAEIKDIRTPYGAYEIPVIGETNREVRLASANFVMTNWSQINIACARDRHFYYRYFAQETDRIGGWARCTLLEWEEFVGVHRKVVMGSSEVHNVKAEICNQRGGESPKLRLQLLQPSGANGS
jgi:hypothetical protein